MQRLFEIKKRLEVIEAALGEQYPRYHADPALSSLVTELKDYVEEELKKIQRQLKRGELSEFESDMIEPAIRDVYSTSIDRLRRGAKPSSEMHDFILDTSSTLSHWLSSFENHDHSPG